MKRIRIAQSDGLDWKKELRKYVTVYRSITHPSTGKSPAELLFNRKIRGKLPELLEANTDLEVCDRDTEQKAKSKLYADTRRGAQQSHAEEHSSQRLASGILFSCGRIRLTSSPPRSTQHHTRSSAGPVTK